VGAGDLEGAFDGDLEDDGARENDGREVGKLVPAPFPLLVPLALLMLKDRRPYKKDVWSVMFLK
jgi:hypothetical protein